MVNQVRSRGVQTESAGFPGNAQCHTLLLSASPAGSSARVVQSVCVWQSLMHSDLVTVMRGGAAYSKSTLKPLFSSPFILLASTSPSVLICGSRFLSRSLLNQKHVCGRSTPHHSQKKSFGHEEGSCGGSIFNLMN